MSVLLPRQDGQNRLQPNFPFKLAFQCRNLIHHLESGYITWNANGPQTKNKICLLLFKKKSWVYTNYKNKKNNHESLNNQFRKL